MSALPPPPDGNRDRAPKLLAIFWAQISISFLFVAARAYVRISIKRLRWDDYTMFACWVKLPHVSTYDKDKVAD